MKNAECRNKALRGIGSRAMRHSLFVILAGIFCLATSTVSFGQSSNRWLFVFNTSSNMRDRSKGLEAVTEDLLTTAMHGNIHAGDSIGIWTFDKQLRADEVPLQTWNPKGATSTAQGIMQFLHAHPYKNSAAFGDVMTNMLRVIEMSDFITIILVSDGNDPVRGTPIDTQLQAFYKNNYQLEKKARMPIITVFRGENGNITTNTVTLAPWPVEIPVVPPPIVAKAVRAKPAPTPPPAPVVPSMIVIGKKVEMTTNVPTDLPDHSGDMPDPIIATPKPAEVPTPKPEPQPAPKAEDKPVATPPAAVVEPKPMVAPVAETPKPQPEPETPVASAVVSNASPVKAATPPAQPPVETAMTTPQTNLFSARNIAVVSVAFTVIVCGLLIMSARNARKASRVSLITSSLDREDK